MTSHYYKFHKTCCIGLLSWLMLSFWYNLRTINWFGCAIFLSSSLWIDPSLYLAPPSHAIPYVCRLMCMFIMQYEEKKYAHLWIRGLPRIKTQVLCGWFPRKHLHFICESIRAKRVHSFCRSYSLRFHIWSKYGICQWIHDISADKNRPTTTKSCRGISSDHK